MRALLDVNFLIALFDPDHVFHEQAHNWWAGNVKAGWASCPLTENGVVRIMSNPNYSDNIDLSPSDLIDRIRMFAEQTNHEFWADDISFRDNEYFEVEKIYGSRQITDIYLLALANKNGGRLVTFDQGVTLSPVIGAKPENLVIV